MSREYQGQNPLDIAKKAEQDLNSYGAKVGDDASGLNTYKKAAGDSTTESGVDDTVRHKFPGADVTYGSAASGAGQNREIPESEGGGVYPDTGRPLKVADFGSGVGAPEAKAMRDAERRGGNDDVREDVR
ncbi:hypothetical protein M501DRAFT_928263 [Patellaria atrata CBS 101060]|uniref:Uncharacterized protein n=1 Tax=Patellaria atrata CBS 101060 TaxID=1346257 RepID=A0A9P4SHE7_9PEZI|nr:hypothetical protein M501DRAFT_928263 [Patellaria atrata CBS 101060]